MDMSKEPKASPIAASIEDSPLQSGERESERDSLGRAEITFDPRYEILGEQGRGGLGRVFRARDLRLDRPVALKELADPTPQAAARFVREVKLTARLQHPAIVPIYEIGTRSDGTPFYAMKLVDGRPLKDVIAASASFEDRLALVSHVVTVAEAIAYAHAQGIIHRDLKPANVIVGPFGETVVIDWGLAKDLREADPVAASAERASLEGVRPSASLVRTRDGEMMGTPAYMPPEQMRGEGADERADVFALGGMLYHVLTGSPPYHGDSLQDAVSRILAAKPVPLRELESAVPAELVAIVEKAMAAEPKDRYPTAKELAADLVRYQTGQLVGAHRYTMGAIALRFVRAHRAAFSVVGAFVLALALAGWFAVQGVRRERDRAEAARAQAEARTFELTLIHAKSSLDRDPTDAIAWVRTYPSAGPAWRDAAAIAAEAEQRGVARWVQELFPRSWVRDMRLSSDGRFAVACDELHEMATVDLDQGAVVRLRHPDLARWVTFLLGDSQILAASDTGKLTLFDRAGAIVREVGTHPGGVRSLEPLPSGGGFVTGGADGTVRVFDLTTGDSRVLGSHEGAVDQLVVTAHGKVASISRYGSVHVWESQSGRHIGTRSFESGSLRSRVAASADGSVVAVVEADQSIAVLDDRMSVVRRRTEHSAAIGALAVAPDGRTVASADGPTVQVWNVETGKLHSLQGHTKDVGVLRFSPDGRTLASTGLDGDIRLWDVATAQATQTLRGHARNVIALAFRSAAAGTAVVSADQGGVMRVWPLAEDAHRKFAGHTQDIVPMLFSPSGARIASGSNDKTVRLWDVATGESQVLRGHTEPVRSLAFAKGGVLVSGGLDDSVRVWSEDGRELRTFRDIGHTTSAMDATPASNVVAVATQDGARLLDVTSGQVTTLPGRPTRSIAIASDGRLVATGGEDFMVRLWDPSTGASLAVLEGHAAELGPLVFSHDGARLASGDRDGVIHVWDVASRTRVATLRGHDRRIVTLQFSPDGALLASGSNDRTVRVWDAVKHSLLAILPHDDHVAVVAFSPDGRVLGSAGNDATVRLWDGHSFALVALHHQANIVTALSFAPDGKAVASAGWDELVRLWPIDPKVMLPAEPDALKRRLETLTNARR